MFRKIPSFFLTSRIVSVFPLYKCKRYKKTFTSIFRFDQAFRRKPPTILPSPNFSGSNCYMITSAEGQTVGRWCVSRRKRFFVQKNIHKVKQPHRNCVLYCRLQLVATLETHVGDMEWKKIEPDWIIVSHNCAIKPQVFFISILL